MIDGVKIFFPVDDNKKRDTKAKSMLLHSQTSEAVSVFLK